MTNENAKQITAITSDGKLEPVTKLHAHKKGIHHLAISVFIFSGRSMLIQQRALGKYHSGGLWTNACCSHPDWGESPEACAARRVNEELGISVPLKQIGAIDYTADVGNGLIESEHVYLFVGGADADMLSINIDPEEISATRWIDIDELGHELTQMPEQFTAWFQQYMSRQDPSLLAIRAFNKKDTTSPNNKTKITL